MSRNGVPDCYLKYDYVILYLDFNDKILFKYESN